MKMKLKVLTLLSLGLLLGNVSPSYADTITGFSPVQQNGTSQTDYNAGAQFSASFYDNKNGTVTFDFKNTGSIQSTIANIYFQDGPFVQVTPIIVNVTNDVNWVPGSNPGSPPGLPNFNTDVQFNTSAANPKPADGINNFNSATDSGFADELRLTFQYCPNVTFADVEQAVTSGKLAIAFHVINYADGGSVTFLGHGDSGGPGGGQNPTPLPRAAWAGLPLLGLVALRRRFARNSA